MLYDLPLDIFWILFGLFAAFLGIAIATKQGILLMFAGIFLIVIILPVNNFEGERLLNSTEDDITSNSTLYHYNDPELVPFDPLVKVMSMLFPALLLIFGMYVWRSDQSD